MMLHDRFIKIDRNRPIRSTAATTNTNDGDAPGKKSLPDRRPGE
jgi:hypothetical protein